MPEKRFAEGIYFALPRAGAKEFVLGSISVKADLFIDWLNGEERNSSGYVNFDVLMSKAGKPYITVNDYRGKSESQPKPAVAAQAESTEPEEESADPF